MRIIVSKFLFASDLNFTGRPNLQGPPLGIDILYLVLADRSMHVRFGLKVVWGS